MKERLEILIVDDSIADATLISEVFEDEQINANLAVVRDGIKAMQYLRQNSGARLCGTRLDRKLAEKKDGSYNSLNASCLGEQ